jgi:ATP-binding cassette subfamily B (MDR/TAP) protein 1
MNKTTIVITHELSQIESQDFVYVLKSGTVVEQGFRGDLEEGGRGEFRRMTASQGQVPRSVPTVEETEPEDEEEEEKPIAQIPPSLKHQSLAIRPLTFGNLSWMFDVVAELTRLSTLNPPPPNFNVNGLSVPELAYHPSKKQDTLTTRLSRLAFPFATQTQLQIQPIRPPLPTIPPLHLQPQKNRRPSSALFPNTPLTIDTFTSDVLRKSRRFSAPGQTPTSATFTVVDREWEDVDLKGSAESKDYDTWWDRESEREEEEEEEEEEFEKDKKAIARSGSVVHEKRKKMCRGGRGAMNIKVENQEDESTNEKPSSTNPQRLPSFFRTSRQTLPTVPSKPLFVFGLALATLCRRDQYQSDQPIRWDPVGDLRV